MDLSLVLHSVTCLLFKKLKQRLICITSFRLSKSLYSRSLPLERTDKFGTVFLNLLARIIYETKFLTHVSFLFFIFYLSYRFKIFPSTHKTFLLFMAVAMLSLLQSTVNCSSRNAVSKNELPLLLSFPRSGICVAT